LVDGPRHLGRGDEEGEAPAGGHEAGGGGKDGFEALDGAQGDQAGKCGREVFGAPGSCLDVCQGQGADDFAQESDLLVVGF